jgi:hypothetical protein
MAKIPPKLDSLFYITVGCAYGYKYNAPPGLMMGIMFTNWLNIDRL